MAERKKQAQPTCPRLEHNKILSRCRFTNTIGTGHTITQHELGPRISSRCWVYIGLHSTANYPRMRATSPKSLPTACQCSILAAPGPKSQINRFYTIPILHESLLQGPRVDSMPAAT
jgi:hypothetical protein